MISELDSVALRQRVPMEVVRRQAEAFLANRELCALLDAVPTHLLILNACRQIIQANRALLDLVGAPSLDSILGRRPGEVLACEHAFETCDGCGTAEACATCGAACAIVTAHRHSASAQECRIHQKQTGRSLDLRVSASPIDLGGQTFTMLAFTDISHEKRRMALERIFFHDLINVAGALSGYTQLLQRATPQDTPEIAGCMQRLANTLLDEIRAQRELAAAETGDLVVHSQPVNSLSLLRDIADIYRSHHVARGRSIVIDPSAVDTNLQTDKGLLIRVLGNMTKNALEACNTGEIVTLSCRADTDTVEFHVHNPAIMPREVQLQVFQRSFSTKGWGRGLGTYSIKLLTERYLGGTVSFTSMPLAGTTFRARYPRRKG